MFCVLLRYELGAKKFEQIERQTCVNIYSKPCRAFKWILAPASSIVRVAPKRRGQMSSVPEVVRKDNRYCYLSSVISVVTSELARICPYSHNDTLI